MTDVTANARDLRNVLSVEICALKLLGTYKALLWRPMHSASRIDKVSITDKLSDARIRFISA